MKFLPPLRPLLSSLLCLGLLTSAAHAANPLKAIGSGIKKVGSALTPWKKKEAPESPAPVAKPAAPKPAAKPKATAKPSAPKAANKKTAASRAPSKTKKTASDATGTHEPSTNAKRKGANGEATGLTDPGAKTKSKTNQTDNTRGGDEGGEKPGDASSPPDSAANNPAADAPESKPAAAAPIPLADIPFGTPVMGKRGHVRSPYAEDQGMVDVTGIPAGTKVKCPFSGKIFRVP